MRKKGIIGLKTTGIVITSLLILAVLSVATFLSLQTIRDAYEGAETLSSGTVSNETLTTVTSVEGEKFEKYYLRNVICTITNVCNSSNGATITTVNYTQSGCWVKSSGGNVFNNTDWKVSYTYTYNSPEANVIVGNITEGTTQFFKNAPTFFVLLGVIVLILMIGIVIAVVAGFGGGIEGKGGGNIAIGAGRVSGSDYL